MQAASAGSKNGDHLDSMERAKSAAGQGLFTLGDRVRLRADLGQSQPGSSSLSPQAYRVEATTAELALSEILSITSVHAPRYYGGRSLGSRRFGLPKVAGQIGGLSAGRDYQRIRMSLCGP
jgi:hypothetical protein